MIFWLQDRLGWRVVEWSSGCNLRFCRSCGPRFPMRREPRWWNSYGKRLVRDFERRDRGDGVL